MDASSGETGRITLFVRGCASAPARIENPRVGSSILSLGTFFPLPLPVPFLIAAYTPLTIKSSKILSYPFSIQRYIFKFVQLFCVSKCAK